MHTLLSESTESSLRHYIPPQSGKFGVSMSHNAFPLCPRRSLNLSMIFLCISLSRDVDIIAPNTSTHVVEQSIIMRSALSVEKSFKVPNHIVKHATNCKVLTHSVFSDLSPASISHRIVLIQQLSWKQFAAQNNVGTWNRNQTFGVHWMSVQAPGDTFQCWKLCLSCTEAHLHLFCKNTND